MWSSKALVLELLLIATAFGRPSEESTNGTVVEGVPGDVPLAAGDDYRLNSETLTISDYDIVIKPDFYANGEIVTFTGEVKINGYFNANMKRITLHAGNNLRIVSARINYSSGNVLQVLSTVRDPEREFLHLDYNGNLFTGFYITIVYTGTFTGNMDGFYKTFYKVGEEQRMLLVTQFEPTMARRAFPCFDEPRWKANFKLTIYAPQGYGALSNTPLDKTESDWGTSETTKYVFQRTPKMPPYSLAFMLYEEDSYGRTPFGVVTQSEVSIFTWGPTSDIDAGRADYSLPVTAKALDVLEKYTAWPYRHDNITKVDQTVVPNFRLQGRENWGLISYRVDRLFLEPQETTVADVERVEAQIANELAHQWFGNLVTPSWWSDAWLSEGLDAYLQYWVLRQLHPDWRLEDRLVLEQQLRAMEEDARAEARALTDPVYTPEQIDGKLNAFTSAKGASIIRLISIIIGEGTLRDALRSYVSSKNHRSVTTADLGSTLNQHNPGNITYSLSQILEWWTSDPGVPLITVTRDYSTQAAQAIQERFYYTTQSNAEKTEYFLYVSLVQGSRRTDTFMLRDATSPTTFSNLENDQWVLLTNTGYYRVNYDEQNWAQLLTALKGDREQIAPLDRAQLVDDSLHLARAGARTYHNALALVEYLSVETDYVPWAAALPGLHFLQRMLVNIDANGSLGKFTQHILTNVYASLSFWDGGSHLDKLLRAKVLRAACQAGYQECLDSSKIILSGFLDDDKPLEPNLRAIVLCFGLQQGLPTDWRKVYNLLATSDVDSQRADMISALGCTKHEQTLIEFVEITVKDEYLRNYERPSAFAAVYANPAGVDLALDTLVTNFDHFLFDSEYGFGEKELKKIIQGLAEYLVTSDQAQKLRSLASQYPEMSDVLNAAYNVAESNSFWVTTYGRSAVEALEAATPVSTSSTDLTLLPGHTTPQGTTDISEDDFKETSTTELPESSVAESTKSTVALTESTVPEVTESTVTEYTDSTVTEFSSSPSPENPPPSQGKSYIGLIIVIIVILVIWAAGSIILVKRYKKNI